MDKQMYFWLQILILELKWTKSLHPQDKGVIKFPVISLVEIGAQARCMLHFLLHLCESNPRAEEKKRRICYMLCVLYIALYLLFKI